MARYYDLDKLAEMIRAKADTLTSGKEAFLYVAKWLDFLPAADGVIELPCKVNDSIFILQGKSVAEKRLSGSKFTTTALLPSPLIGTEWGTNIYQLTTSAKPFFAREKKPSGL